MSYSRTLTFPSLLHENHLNALHYTIFFLIAPELLRPLSFFFFSGVGCLFKGLSMSLRRFPCLCKRSLSVSVRAKPHLERGGGPSLRSPRKNWRKPGVQRIFYYVPPLGRIRSSPPSKFNKKKRRRKSRLPVWERWGWGESMNTQEEAKRSIDRSNLLFQLPLAVPLLLYYRFLLILMFLPDIRNASARYIARPSFRSGKDLSCREGWTADGRWKMILLFSWWSEWCNDGRWL